MADSKKCNATRKRLKQQLRKKEESFADEFNFKIFIVFNFKNKNKKKCMFEIVNSLTLMNNDFEDEIRNGAKASMFSYDSGEELINKDIVQLHATGWKSLRIDLSGQASDIDFLLWPRSDIDTIECLLFSCWKHERDQRYKPLRKTFTIDYSEVAHQLEDHAITVCNDVKLVQNKEENFYLFVKKQSLESPNKVVEIGKLQNICLYIPQDQLMNWDIGSSADMVEKFFFA